MAVAQFTQQFLANLPSVNGIKTLNEFYDKMLAQTQPVDRIEFLQKLIDEQADFLPKLIWYNGKDDEKSRSFRANGNQCFKRMEYVEALKWYNKALAHAKTSKAMGVCYANRSAVYFQLKMYRFCLDNIQLATECRLTEASKSKLKERQLSAQKHLLHPAPVPPRKFELRLCRPPFHRQPFFINCLSKINDDNIVTQQALHAGSVISMERPYCQILSQSHIYERCTYCLTNKKYLSMIPCRRCSTAMFCNTFCYKMAKKLFHRFECAIIDGLFHFLTDSMYLGLRTIFVSLNDCNGSMVEYQNRLMRCFNDDTDPFNVITTSDDQTFNEMVFRIIHNSERSFKFSIQHHVTTAVLMGKLKAIFNSRYAADKIISTVLFHMLQVSEEKCTLLEETAFSGDGVGNDVSVFGCGLFPFASQLKTSCAPNVIFLNRNGVLVGITIRPILIDEEIVPGYMSRNHFLTERHRRIQRMQTSNCQLCHCLACRDDYELFAELPPIQIQLNGSLPLIAETFANVNEIIDALRLVCSYLNGNHRYLPYLSREMGWCIQAMIRLFRQLVETYDADNIFTEYSKLIRSV